jgi:amidase
MLELMFKPAAELASLVRGGELGSRELVEDCLGRIEALQPDLNAFVHVDPEGAREAAEAVGADDERPFAGVPIAVKDTAPVAGMPFSMGSDVFGDFVPQHDAFLVRRLREAGFVIVGKTSLPEFGILPVTEPRRFGPTRNPWDLERTPGGSSGGAAAAVASGMVPLAHGSDGGGSIRIPAACCGLVGLKPARGRVSRGPEQGDDFLVQDGVLTHTVAETAQLLDVLAGYETGDATWAPPPAEPFAAAVREDPGRLRIGFTLESPIESELDPACARAVHDAAELLAGLGHEVEEVPMAPWTGEDLLRVFTLVFSTPVSAAAFFGGMVTQREPTEELLEPLSWTIWKEIRERSALEYYLARTQLNAYTRGIVALWDDYDVVMTPSLAQRPVRIGEIDSCSDEPWEDFRRSGAFTPYTAIFNVTGQPALTLPLFQGDDGLPTGVQLAGRPADEATLLSLGAQLETAAPWAERRPALANAGRSQSGTAPRRTCSQEDRETKRQRPRTSERSRS